LIRLRHLIVLFLNFFAKEDWVKVKILKSVHGVLIFKIHGERFNMVVTKRLKNLPLYEQFSVHSVLVQLVLLL
jgi:hypothetical protein